MIAAIHIPLLPGGRRFVAYKLSKRFDQDISTVVAAFRLALDGDTVRDIRAAYGGMAARAQRAAHLEAALTGRAWSDAYAAPRSMPRLARDFTPMGDHRGSAAYRLRAAANLVRRLQLETTSRGADPRGGAMNTPLARIRGGVHTAVRHDSAVGHVTGRALYIDDVPNVAGTLEAALVLSPHAHARIRRIDFSRALAAPGVVAAITASDIPGKNDIAPIRSDEPLLAADLVEYDGQPVAAIAAATLDEARAAAKLVDDRLRAAAGDSVGRGRHRARSLRRAAADHRARRCRRRRSPARRIGSPARCAAAARIISISKARSRSPRRATTATCMCCSSTQHPTEVQHGVAHLLGLPFNAVTAEVRRMGGAFGGKESQATIIAGIAAVLAWKTRRPVKLRLPRDDDMRATGKRHPFLIRYDVGFDGDGRILGARPDARRQRRQRRRPHARGRHPRAVPRRQLLLAAACPLPRPVLQDPHGVEHRVPRLRRPAGHAGDRDHHRDHRAASRPAGRRPCARATTTASAATT